MAAESLEAEEDVGAAESLEAEEDAGAAEALLASCDDGDEWLGGHPRPGIVASVRKPVRVRVLVIERRSFGHITRIYP